MSYVYVLKSIKYSKLYVGSTTDLDRLIFEHNAGLSIYTNLYKPWVVIYTEKFVKIEDARKREKYFKSCAGRKFLKKNINIPG